MPVIQVAIAQTNVSVGDLNGNYAKLCQLATQAAQAGADLLLTPECYLSGYPPEDLLFSVSFQKAVEETLARLIDTSLRWPRLKLVVGHPEFAQDSCYNAASVIGNGKRLGVYYKQHLPNVAVFDEVRYFSPGAGAQDTWLLDVAGVRCALTICEDLWQAEFARKAKEAGAKILLALNASPLHLGKQAERESIARQVISAQGMATVYANLVGGQDELVFDGSSFVLDSKGDLQCRLPQFTEQLAFIRLDKQGCASPLAKERSDELAAISPLPTEEGEAWQALVLGVSDYVGKNGFPGVLLGLSGGIDSALALCIAVDALGAQNVRAIMLPSPYTAQMSLEDARALTTNLGVSYNEIPIEPAMQTLTNTLQAELAAATHDTDTTLENLQARIRGLLLMAISNRSGALLLSTGNKSEMAVGYATLYGDMAGGFAVLKDVYKTLVYRLALYYNQRAGRNVIPSRIISRPPTAELKPGQSDQDSLPSYEVLDAIIALRMDQNQSAAAIIAQGYQPEDVSKVLRLLRLAEYKRRQSPIGVRITPRGFGKDWRYPVSNRYYEFGPARGI